MKAKLKLLAIMFSILIISLPICFATELNYIYDANGNLITGDGKYREYNSLNQLARIYNGTNSSGTLLEEYSYHPTEERIYKKKVYNSDTSLKETVIYASKTFVKIINSSGEYNYTYVSFNGQLIAQSQDGNKYFMQTDNKGTVVVVTNQSGNVIENSSYDPFGALLSGGSLSRKGYEGKEFSSVVGDTDFNFRKYDASRGQFIQPDTLIQNIYDPQSFNRYSFERNNPYKHTDPAGHNYFLIGALITAGAIVASAALMGVFVGIKESAKESIFAPYQTIDEARKQGVTPEEMLTNAEIRNKIIDEINNRMINGFKNGFKEGAVTGFLDKSGALKTVGDIISLKSDLTYIPKSNLNLGGVVVSGASGVKMTLSDRTKNTQTVSTGGFTETSPGVFSKTWTEVVNGKTYINTRVVYT